MASQIHGEMIPSLDTYTAMFTWDDGNSDVLTLGVEKFWATASHMYGQEGIYHIVLTLVDDPGGEAIAKWDVMVGSIPFVEAGPDGCIDEGSTFTSSGFIADADSPAFTAIVDYNDQTGPQPLQLNEGNTFDLSHTYVDNGVYTVLVTVFKEDMDYESDTMYVTVNNAFPHIESLSLSPTNPYQPGVLFKLTGIFSGPGIMNTHMVTIDWGDGTLVSSTIEAGVTIARGSHSYANAGEYTITLTLIDNNGGSNQYRYILS